MKNKDINKDCYQTGCRYNIDFWCIAPTCKLCWMCKKELPEDYNRTICPRCMGEEVIES